MTVIDLSRTGVSTRPCGGDLRDTIAAALRRWPSAGVAVAVVGDHSTVQYFCHGVADVASGRRISEDTVFRIGSLTKTITAVAVMQLCEQGLIDLDALANDYLREFELVPVSAGFGPATVRHLLTHTAGVGYWRRRSDLLLHPGAGRGHCPVGGSASRVLPRRPDCGRGARDEVGVQQPRFRRAWPDRRGRLRRAIRPVPARSHLRSAGDGPAPASSCPSSWARTWPPGTPCAGEDSGRSRHGRCPPAPAAVVYSTPADMSRYLTALLHGGANEHGRVLTADSVRTLFRPHFQPDSRVAGMALGFEPHTERGRILICKGGTLNGFLSALEMAPEAGVGVVVLTNTGGLDNRGVPEPLAAALTRRLLGMPASPVRDDIAPTRRCGMRCAAGTRPTPAPSRTCSRGWDLAPGWRWPSATAGWC